MYSNSLTIGGFLLLNLVSSGLSCFSAFKNAENVTFVQLDCAKSAGFTSTPSTDEMAMDSFDDKCMSKCVLNAFQTIDNEGQLDKDVLLDFLELNAPDSYLLKLSELANTCSESSGADKIEGGGGTKTGKSPKECKPMRNMYSCFLQGSEKLC